ncbi:glycogen debranching N-terminal domain-containing protein [Micromonospora sp. WMMD1082]|uniref:amylo-alpha-1,6-glucosidase n=1 Tax=Micromonospora sp. WMMD1082 TaxID=3016104 RepID=UPI00241695A3|nr:glycogen debranching N-terminal domain-containing protein [Micromonospora sp. WMMD1082]MDG4798105.1 glycogen debranching N-terminal domain-containing protein [Micromonospora sp. WMMD1082]
MTTAKPRPTPADPMPAERAEPGDVAGVPRDLPPELGPDAVSIMEASTFMLSNALGDVPPHSIGGLVHDDTRHLSCWRLTVNDTSPLLLGASVVDHYSAAFFLAVPELPGIPANAIGIRRQRFVGDGLHERIELHSFAREPKQLRLRLVAGADFADLFEIKSEISDRSHRITRTHASDGSQLTFTYSTDHFHAETRVCAWPFASRVDGDGLVWDVTLLPGRRWSCELTVPLGRGIANLMPRRRDFGEVFDGDQDDPTGRWRAVAPVLRADSDRLRAIFEQSIRDLIALRIEKCINGERVMLPAAGLPWFLTVFGRDTLITAYQTLSFAPQLAHGALIALASHQGTTVDDFRDEEPGKILHEYRVGELTVTGQRPHNPYFGAADSTQLWLIVLSEYWRWTGDDELVHHLREQAYAALRWIDRYGDRDGDGYVEYATRSLHGLGNQCWRDSWDGIQFADGEIPYLPIATCETQGYTYDAKLRMAELADGPLGDPELARRLRAEAAELYERFNRDFWLDDRGGFYAIGLDGDKQRIDSMTSNMGQLLWSGIVPPERARRVADHLMSPHLFSGWGVRTTATSERGYNPIGYHMGTVWPHDNSLIAHGLARYGFRAEANRIIVAMLEAAGFTDNRLPEAISGYDRTFGRTPVPYPTACNPQAWSSAAPLLFLRTMLGLDARDGELRTAPDIPAEFGRLHLRGTNAFGQRWDIDAAGTHATVRPS